VRLKLTLRRPMAPADLIVDVDGSTTVGALADVLARSDPAAGSAGEPSVASPTLTVESVAQPGLTLDPALTVADAGIASGQYVTLAAAPRSTGAAAVLSVLAGPDAGRSYELGRGVSTIGRDEACTVTLSDPMVSKGHARIVVADTVEIVDDNSSNGVVLGSDRVQRVELRDGDAVLLGDSLISVQRAVAPGSHSGSGPIPFTRSPRLDPQWEGLELVAPDPPTPPGKQRFPLATLLLPILMGGVLFAFIASQPGVEGAAKWMPVVFFALSPLMVLGSYIETKRANRKDFEEAVALFEENLAQLTVELRQGHDAERVGRNAEHPSTADVVTAVQELSPLVWCRRPDQPSFAEVRLGLGSQPSRTTVETTKERNSPVALQRQLEDTVSHFRVVDNVPVTAVLSECGSIGISGPVDLRSAIARALVAQVAGLHSPAELTVVALASPRSAPAWDWIKWLPHVGGDHHPLSADPLSVTAPGCGAIVAELLELIEERSEQRDAAAAQDGPPPLPVVLVLVEDDAPVERASIVRLMEAGRRHGVHVVWLSDRTGDVPASARTFLEVAPEGTGAAIGKVIEAEHVSPVVLEQLDLAAAEWFARRLAPVVDSGAGVNETADVPQRVSFLAEAGTVLADSTTAVIERWTESNSLRLADAPARRAKRDNTLRAFVGRTGQDPFHLDLRTDGPHALVGGTTGAGKSEFLQTWILGMAAAHSPQRVTFLFVDYKGGAAFADCVRLPHAVGLVTDLSAHLVQRALVSLNAELRYREHVLNAKKAKDLLELERRGDPECPPSLVIVVDEFAALVQEVPEFVDGVVNVAQRGRSLGLHLILATQRPAGVIKDNLRANTNLRVALRMADEDDSNDVVGSALAGTFDPGIPGRAVAKRGPGRLTVFQSGYVGGWTSDNPPPPPIGLATLVFGVGETWELPEDPSAGGAVDDLGPTDIQRLVGNLSLAAVEAGVEPPRKPWLPDLADTYDLASLPLPRRDAELVIGVADFPDRQMQDVVAFRPDLDGNMAVFGTGGSGKSNLLRTIAVSAGFTRHGGPCVVYGLDYGSRGLSMLEALPHVGSIIGADDAERTERLLTFLRQTIDERAVRYAAVNAGTIDEYRRIADRPDEQRILLLVDNFGAFRSAYETGPSTRVFDSLISLAGDGRPVGVHLVVSADRVGAVPSTLGSTIQRQLALRVASEMDESMLRVPKDGFGENPPPGRGFLDGTEVQVAVLGGSSDVSQQAEAMDRLAESMRRAGAVEAATIRRLPDEVHLAELPVEAGGLPVFAMADDTLDGIGFEPSGCFLVAGPAGSGRTTAVRALVAGLRRTSTARSFVWMGPARSPLADDPWDRTAPGVEAVSDLAAELASTWAADPPPAGSWVVVLDGLGELAGSDADYALQDLLKACRSAGVLVIAEGETADLSSYSDTLKMIKSSATGVVLQPDQTDGDALFRTTFSRMSRADFPVGRGMYVRGGRARRVQVALT